MSDISKRDHDALDLARLRTPPGGLDLFLNALGRVNIAIGGGLAIIASVLLWAFAASAPVPLWLIALVGLPFLMSFASLALALRAAGDLLKQQAAALAALKEHQASTEIVDAVPPSLPGPKCEILLIVKWSQAAVLPVGANVAVTVVEAHHERQLGLGTVREKNQAGYYVVSIDELYDGAEIELYIRQLGEENSKPTLLKKLRILSAISIKNIPAKMLFSVSRPSLTAWSEPLPKRQGRLD